MKRVIVFLVIFIFNLLIISPLRSEVLKVGEINILGNEILDKESILKVIETEVGKPLFKEVLTKDLREIYKLGYFNDVKIEILRKEKDLVVNYILVEKPTISQIKFKNNEEIKEEELRENYSLIEGDLFDELEFRESVKKLEDYYRSKGYYYVKIDSKIKEISPRLLNITLKIDEGEKTEIKRINFEGNNSFSSWRLRWIISTGKGDYFIEDKIKEDIEKISYFYNNRGYFLSKVKLGKVYYDQKKKGLVVNFKIEEGDIFTIKDIKIKGATLFKEEELKRVIQSSSGKIYSLKRIREDQYKIMEMYSKKGYIAVQIIPKPIIHKDLKMVSFEIEILEGEKCYLEKVTVSGNKVTEDKVILREVLLKPGDVFDGQKVSLTRQKLYQLGFFELVDMEIIPGSEKNKKLLNIKVKERKTGTITMGATWSNQYGFGATTEIAQNNLFGKGWKINFKGEFSKKRVDYRFGFINPWFYDTPTSLGVDIYNTTSKINLYKTTQKGGSISIGRPWKTFNKIYLDYRYERVLFSEVEENAPSDIKEREGVEETTSSFSLTFIRDTRDRIYHPSKGYRISFLNEFAGEILGGDVDYHKSILENRIYIPIFWKFVLAMRAKIGSIRSITGDEKVRDDFRFYLGGADSVRGYREEEIYLVDERGIEHGGNSFFLANIEYRFPLVKPLYFAFFFDMGNIWNRYNSIDLKNLKKGYGFYFLIETPMGPIRLDYGYPLDDKDKSEPEIYFSIGAPF